MQQKFNPFKILLVQVERLSVIKMLIVQAPTACVVLERNVRTIVMIVVRTAAIQIRIVQDHTAWTAQEKLHRLPATKYV